MLFVGVVFVSLVWFKDTQWSNWGYDFKYFHYLKLIIFAVGIVAILLSMFSIIWEQVWSFLRSIFFKIKYPRKKLGEHFELVATGDRVWLLEKKGKKRWVANTTTYHHLHFWWSDKKDVETKYIEKYEEGKIILTHGIPGMEP